MDPLPITPEREAALKGRIRHLHQRKSFTYSELLEDVAKEHSKEIEEAQKRDNDRLKKPISSTFSRWLAGNGDLEREWVLWLEQYLDSNKLSTDYDEVREFISSASDHYIAHATAHYLKIKPETQASAEKEVPGLYAVWAPSNVLPGAFVFGLAQISVPKKENGKVENGVITIQTFQEYRSTAMYFDEIYLERQMRELGWIEADASKEAIPGINDLRRRHLFKQQSVTSDRIKTNTEDLKDSSNSDTERPQWQSQSEFDTHFRNTAADVAILLDRISAQPDPGLIKKAGEEIFDTISDGTSQEQRKFEGSRHAIKRQNETKTPEPTWLDRLVSENIEEETILKLQKKIKKLFKDKHKEIEEYITKRRTEIELTAQLSSFADPENENSSYHFALEFLKTEATGEKITPEEYDLALRMLEEMIRDIYSHDFQTQVHAFGPLPRKRVDIGDGYLYRIRGSFEATVWDQNRISYTRYELPDFERDLGRVTYMKGLIQVRFGKRRLIKPVIFQRLAHLKGRPLLTLKNLQPLLDIYPARLLPLEIRAFFVNEAERLKNRLSINGNLVIEI